MRIDRDKLLRRFVDALYVNNKIEFNRGCFRVNGDTVDIFPAIETFDGAAYRIEFWDDEVDRISSFDPQTGQEIDEQDELNIYPTNLFVTAGTYQYRYRADRCRSGDAGEFLAGNRQALRGETFVRACHV